MQRFEHRTRQRIFYIVKKKSQNRENNKKLKMRTAVGKVRSNGY